MSKTVEFYFDFGSPTSYLAYRRLLQFNAAYGLNIDYRPMLLGGVFKATGNTSPITVPAKGSYMLEHDLPRFATRYGVDLLFNPHFPFNSLTLMRGAIAAHRLDCFERYVDVVYRGVWTEGKNMGEKAIVIEVLSAAELDAEAILAKAAEDEVKTSLIANTDAAVARGVFGAPTMFLDGEMYFGQDRLDFVEAVLKAEE
ncbi:MAG: 2-hydroxychromene-2-carboxylate isomerase [Gammaproteobacteria bacterium]|nr:2-hydroxychromene-2-carboxylate isomerase [Gammaproteobacteria bacterium]